MVWKTWSGVPAKQTVSFPRVSPHFWSGLTSASPGLGKTSLKTAFLAFGPRLEKLTQSPPGICSAASRQEQNLGERKPQRITLSSWLRQGLTIFGWLPTLKNWKH